MPVIKDTEIHTYDSIDPINFEVVKMKAADLLSEYQLADDLTHVIYAPDQNKILSFCSPNYAMTSNRIFFEPVIDLAKEILGEVTLKVSSYDDRRFYVDIIADKNLYEVTKNDRICPMISLANSYDGRVKQSLSLSFYRQVCSNGMKGFATEFDFKAKHSLRSTFATPIEKLREELLRIGEDLDRFRKMTDRRITPDELQELIEDMKENNFGYPKRMIEEVPIIIAQEQIKLESDLNSWLVYNGFNNALMHTESKLLPEQKAKIDKSLLAFINNRN